MDKKLIHLPLLALVAMLSGCSGGDNARASIPPVSTPCPTYTSTIQDDGKAGIITVSVGASKAEGIKKKNIIAASRPMTFGGLVTTSSVGAGQNSGYSSAEYDITYREAITVPNEIVFDITMENKSNRAVQLNGVLLRAKANNEKIIIGLPREITNESKLAPGESIKGEIKVSGLKEMGDLTEIDLILYEVPSEILDNGSIGKRESIVKKISIVKSVRMESCATYTLREKRSWSGNSNNDPSLSRFVR